MIYSVSLEDPHAAIAEKLLADGGYISVQVLNEFVAVARPKRNMSWEDIRDALAAVRILCEPATPLSVKTHEAALDLASQYGYQIYDALILAAALDAQCNILYTEGMQTVKRSERLPFAIHLQSPCDR